MEAALDGLTYLDLYSALASLRAKHSISRTHQALVDINSACTTSQSSKLRVHITASTALAPVLILFVTPLLLGRSEAHLLRLISKPTANLQQPQVHPCRQLYGSPVARKPNHHVLAKKLGATLTRVRRRILSFQRPHQVQFSANSACQCRLFELSISYNLVSFPDDMSKPVCYESRVRDSE